MIPPSVTYPASTTRTMSSSKAKHHPHSMAAQTSPLHHRGQETVSDPARSMRPLQPHRPRWVIPPPHVAAFDSLRTLLWTTPGLPPTIRAPWPWDTVLQIMTLTHPSPRRITCFTLGRQVAYLFPPRQAVLGVAVAVPCLPGSCQTQRRQRTRSILDTLSRPVHLVALPRRGMYRTPSSCLQLAAVHPRR
jgi:hypothetical protein